MYCESDGWLVEVEWVEEQGDAGLSVGSRAGIRPTGAGGAFGASLSTVCEEKR